MPIAQPSKYFEIEKYSHHFVVKKMSPAGQQVAEKFARGYTAQHGLIRVGRTLKRGIVKVFAARGKNKNEIRFHIGHYDLWKNYLADVGLPAVSYTEVEYGHHKPTALNATLKEGWVPRGYQIPIIEYLVSDLPSSRKMVEVQAGRGKLQPNSTPIKVPGGWKKIGDMEVGDYVIAPDGFITTVEGVYPQGKVQLYKVTFGDGRSTLAGAEHLWKIFYQNTTIKRQWRIVDTAEMMRMLGLVRNEIYIPLIQSEKNCDIELSVEPYLLGVILGDGGISSGGINITKLDTELFDNIRPLLGKGLMLKVTDAKTQRIVKDGTAEGRTNHLKVKLENLGLMGKRSWEKFIPPHYLNGSTSQRLKLLQGLMDTDGTANAIAQGGSISYCSTSEQLAKDVQYLVRSLGGIASISLRNPIYTHNGEKKDGRVAYQVNIRYKYPSQLFTLPRKKERTNDLNQYAAGLKLRVTSVEPIESDEESTCIAVAHEERLYVAQDFIVTHNTFMACAGMSTVGDRMVGFLKPKYLEKWVSDLKALLDIDPEDIEVIQGSGSLMKVISQAVAGTLDCKAILVSNRTFQHYINAYEEKGDAILDQGYDCTPEQFIQVIGAGVRLIDEVHEDFHLNFKIDLYTHVPRSISLSATLVSDDQFISKMHEVAYPKKLRYHGLEFDKYVDSFALRYSIQGGDRLRSTEFGSNNYSHMAFEKNFFNNTRLLKAYLDLINYRFEVQYLTRMEAGQKCLIYASSIKMCTFIVEYLKKQHPDLDVRRYVEDDPYENLMKAQVCVSTVGSAGTGHDIPNLIFVLLTVAIASKASNIQGFGRLRRMDGVETVFEYFTCKDIPKHLEYHQKKEILLAGMAKTTTLVDLPYVVGAY